MGAMELQMLFEGLRAREEYIKARRLEVESLIQRRRAEEERQAKKGTES